MRWAKGVVNHLLKGNCYLNAGRDAKNRRYPLNSLKLGGKKNQGKC